MKRHNVSTKEGCFAYTEEALNKEGNRKFTEDVAIKIHKLGGKLPTADQVIAIWSALTPKSDPTKVMDREECELMDTICVSLAFLAQISLASERM